MYCRYCGKELPPDAAFCVQCGRPVQENRPLPIDQSRAETGNRKVFLLAGVILALLIAAAAGAVLIIGSLTGNDKTGSSSGSSSGSSAGKQEYDVELPDIVLYDTQDITITAKGLVDKDQDNGRKGSALYIEIQNDRSDPVDVTATYGFLVNGYALPFIGTTGNGRTEPGETNTCKILFEDQYLDLLNIKEVSSVHAELKIGKIEGKTITGILDTTEGTDIVIREKDSNEPPEGDLCYDENGIRVTYLDYKEGGNYYEAFFLFENASDKDITLTSYKNTEEGRSDRQSSSDAAAGAKQILTIPLYDDEHDIKHDKVEYMEVSCVINDKETNSVLGGFDNYKIPFD